jgi:hypothetical protein
VIDEDLAAAGEAAGSAVAPKQNHPGFVFETAKLLWYS